MDEIEDLEKRLQRLEQTADKAQDLKSNNGILGAVMALILTAVIALGGAWLMHQINKKNKELAKLRTEAEQNKVRENNLRVQAEIAKHDQARETLQREASILRQSIEFESKKIQDSQARYDAAVERISNARSWAELDILNKEGR